MKSYLISLSLILAFTLFAGTALAQNTGRIVLEPANESVSSGEEFKLSVSVDTGEGNGVNSYQAILNYPEEKLEFVSANTDASAFNMALLAEGGNGRVKIVRGSTKPLTGKQFAAFVIFKAKENVNLNEITVSNESAVIRSSDNSNILEGSTVQNESGSGMNASDNQMGQESKSGVWGILDWVKNFFTSLFK